MSGLQPPRIQTQNIGSDGSESSDDHFSSASEGTPNPDRTTSIPQSPIPITRVERVDDRAAHGEIPGTAAYNMRLSDAVPDEIEIVPEGRRSRSDTLNRSRSSSLFAAPRPGTPGTSGGSPIPKTVVDRVDDKPSYGEVDGTEAKEKRLADATPDEVRRAPDVTRASLEGSISMKSENQDSATRSVEIDQTPEERQNFFRSMWEGQNDTHTLEEDGGDDDSQNDDGFGDDFDDFAEGDGDDFGDFDEGVGEAEDHIESTATLPTVLSAVGNLPTLNIKLGSSRSDWDDNITPYLDEIFGSTKDIDVEAEPISLGNSSPFLSDRSLSLWQQLVSPPPMQPPNWIRSRIRRLFLVSLGVPVDLDEILPPSKQKRLILPNVNLRSSSPPSIALNRLKQEGANDSSTSLDSKTGVPKKLKRQSTLKGPPPPPEFDSNVAQLITRTTDEAMAGFSDNELRDHLLILQTLNKQASATLEYWLQRKDDSIKEKEALEGVIENLVGFVKGRRGK